METSLERLCGLAFFSLHEEFVILKYLSVSKHIVERQAVEGRGNCRPKGAQVCSVPGIQLCELIWGPLVWGWTGKEGEVAVPYCCSCK